MGTSSRSISLLLLLAWVRGSVQRSTPASLTYRAAVAELQLIEYTNNAVETLTYCTEKIVQFIELAAEREADIVVFAEMALTSLFLGKRSDIVARSTLVPDPSENYTPCNDLGIPVTEAFKNVACAAQRNSIYVVINLLEKEICMKERCPSDGLLVYITSVVLDRTGKIIAKSRKAHLVDEYDLLDVIEPPELSTFDTDFGVTFGNLVCFDIMFEDTILALTRKLNVTDIVHSSGWFSGMPFLTTIQMEAGWAYAEDINLLSSGYNNMGWGTSGSGIYGGRQGVIAAILPLQDHEELLVADVPKKAQKTVTIPSAQYNEGQRAMHREHHANHRRHMNHKHHMIYENHVNHEHHINEELSKKYDRKHLQLRFDRFDGFQTELIADNGFTEKRLRHIGLDCEFQLNVTSLSASEVTYRLLAYDGTRDVSKSLKLGTRTCAIVLCANDIIDSCGHIWNTPAVFDFINITATYVDNAKTMMMPSTLASDTMPFKDWNWDQYTQEGHVYTSMSLIAPTRNIVTFGLWGRNFEKDERSSASSTFRQFL